MEARLEDSPRPTARTIAFVYLLYFVTAFLALFLSKGLVIPTDAAASATNIVAHQSLYRSGVSVGLIGNFFYLAVVALFYGLFKPVNRTVARLAAFFGLVGCTVLIFAGILQIAPLTILTDSQLAGAFTAPQLHTSALLSVTLYLQTFQLSLVLFGLFDFAIGYLIYKSTFLPRFLGVLWMIAGIGWLFYLWPPLANTLRYIILPVGGVPEIILLVWLFTKGVDVARYREVIRSRDG